MDVGSIDFGRHVAILEWPNCNDYLVSALFPSAQRLPISISGRNDSLLSSLDPGVRCVFIHVDLTDTSIFPADRNAITGLLRNRGITIINAHITDISKRRLQQACRASGIPSVALDGRPPVDDATKVIIKTNKNYGGIPEQRLQMTLAAHPEVAAYEQPATESPQYRICRYGDVTPEVWENQDYVVERFVENSLHLKFRCHVLMDRMVVSAVFDAAPVSRMEWGSARHEMYYAGDIRSAEASMAADFSFVKPLADRIAESIRVLRRDLKMDFGSIDVMANDAGVCFPIDINTTPYWGRPDLDAVVRYLRAADY